MRRVNLSDFSPNTPAALCGDILQCGGFSGSHMVLPSLLSSAELRQNKQPADVSVKSALEKEKSRLFRGGIIEQT